VSRRVNALAAWLEAREAAHARSTDEPTRASIRLRVRRACARAGIEAPAWARTQQTISARRKPKQLELSLPARGARPATSAQAYADVGLAIDASALAALRARAPAGTCVQVNAQGVTLHMVGEVRRYPSIADALAEAV